MDLLGALKWLRSNLGWFYVNRRAQEKLSSRLKRKNVSFVLFVLIFLLPTWKAGSMVANIALHGYCFYNLTQGCFQRSTGIFVNYLDAFQERSKAQRKVNRKKKRGSHGWEREREETLPSPSSFLAVGEDGKKRGQIGKISASEGSRAVAWGRRKNATLSLRQTGLSARFTRRFFFFFPQRGAWSQITWFLPLCFPSAS